MNTGATIAKQAIRILGYINRSIEPEQGYTHDAIINALYSMHKLDPGCAIITCPVSHDNFFYISENCRLVFGYTAQEMASIFRKIENYFAQVHEADMADCKDCFDFLESFMRNELPQDCNRFRTILHYRFRNPEGKYIYLQDERATLVSADATIVHYSLIRAMPDEVIFTGVKMEIYKDGDLFEKVVDYKPSTARNKLSRRENDLVVLIRKGLTTKEIAWQLKISHNTVRNIKSRLFEKYSVNNTIELLNMTG